MIDVSIKYTYNIKLYSIILQNKAFYYIYTLKKFFFTGLKKL